MSAKASEYYTINEPRLKIVPQEAGYNRLMSDALALIHRLCRSAVVADNARPLLEELNAAAMNAVGADRAFVALANDDTGELSTVTTAGEGWTAEYRAMRLKIGEAVNGHGTRKSKNTAGRTGITSHVAATGQPYATGNVDADPYYYAFFDDVRSEIAVPIVDDNDRVRGVINIESFQADYFTEEHLRLVQSLADIAAMRLMMDGYRARETALVEIGKDLSTIPDTSLLMHRVVDVAAEVLRFEDCSLFVLDADKHELVLQASRGPLAHKIGQASYPLGEGLTGWVGRHGEVIRVGNPTSDPRWQGRFEEFPAEDIGAFLAVPIHGRRGVLGVLRVLRRRSVAPWFRREFTDDDESVLLTIASQLGTAIENGRILDRLVNTERMAAWGEMSARAAHMIGNRTFAIKGDLNELEYRLSETEDKRDEFRGLAEGIRRGIFRLEEILQEFRDFVRATQIALTECDLNEIVEQCVRENFPKRTHVTLTLDLAPNLPTVLADPARLKRAFGELIENAVSFQPDGGFLTVRTIRARPPDAIGGAGLPRSLSYVQVEFLDGGPGVSAEMKTRIFTPFYTSRARGLGLGLSIVKGILEAHRGGIVETGRPGEGAHFTAFLPVKKDECMA
jgi:signal transduction histidine kinase